MRRAVNSVVTSNSVIFRPWGYDRLHVYDFEHNKWHQLPDCPFGYSSLVYVQNMLTAVGGECDGELTDKLLSLTWRTHPWEEILPPMPTKRKNPISVTAGKKWLVVSGGIQAEQYLTIVEVLNIESKLWTTVASLPEPIFNASVTYDRDDGLIYMLGGNREPGCPTTTVLACQVDDLIQSEEGNAKIWRNLADLPVERSSCVFLCGHLLAIGGQYHSSQISVTLSSASSPARLSSSVYKYITAEDRWSVVSDLGMPVSECFAAVLPGNKLMVLGGNTRQGVTDRVLLGTVDNLCSL